MRTSYQANKLRERLLHQVAALREISDAEVDRAIRSVPRHFANTTLYLRSDTAISIGTSTAPTNWLEFWTVKPSIVQKALSTSAGSGQQTMTLPTSSFTSGQGKSVAAMQYISAPLSAGSYSSGAWAIGGAATGETGWTCGIRIFLDLVNGSTGAVRTNIIGATTPGGTTNSVSEQTFWGSTISGASFTAVAGDLLVLEYGQSLGNQSGSTATNSGQNVYDCGTTAITSNGTSISSAQSFVQAPFTIAFQSGGSFDLSQGYFLPVEDGGWFMSWKRWAEAKWRCIFGGPTSADSGPAWFLNDPFSPPPGIAWFNPTVETPRNASIFIMGQREAVAAPKSFDPGPGFFTDDPNKALPAPLAFYDPTVEFPRNTCQQQLARWLIVAPSFAAPVLPEDQQIAAKNIEMHVQPELPRRTAWRRPVLYETDVAPVLPEDFEAAARNMQMHFQAQVPARPAWRRPVLYEADNWPASDPILVLPPQSPVYVDQAPSPLPSRVKRPLPPLHEVPFPIAAVTAGGGGSGTGTEINHGYEVGWQIPQRPAYKRPVLQGGMDRPPTFLVEVIEDVYQVWNVQQTQPVRTVGLRPQATVASELARTAPAQIPPMIAFDVAPVMPARRWSGLRTGETVTKLVPVLQDVSVAQGWNVPVAPRPVVLPSRPFTPPETIATLEAALDVTILRFDVPAQPPPGRRRSVAPSVIAQPVLPADKGQDFAEVWYAVAPPPTPRGRPVLHLQPVTLEAAAPAQVPPMLPFDVAATFVPRRPLGGLTPPRAPADAPSKLIASLQDVPQFESWVQATASLPTRQPRTRPLAHPADPPQTAFFLNVPFDPASFQPWQVAPQMPTPWRRVVAVAPQQQVDTLSPPPWQSAGVIVVSGPYVVVTGAIYVAGAVQGEARNQ